MALDKIKFQTNIRLELALKFSEGKLCDSQFGDPQYMFTTTDDRVFFVAEKVAQKIHGLRLQPREPFDIVKAEVDYGNGRKGIEWQIAKVGFAPGEQPDGTFAVPALPQNGRGANVSPSAPVMAKQPQQQTPNNGHDTTGNGSNGHAAVGQIQVAPPPPAVAAVPTERPKTKLEDALKTVVAAVVAANEYAKQIGYAAMPQFSSEDIRTMANTIIIQNGGGKSYGS